MGALMMCLAGFAFLAMIPLGAMAFKDRRYRMPTVVAFVAFIVGTVGMGLQEAADRKESGGYSLLGPG